MSIEKIVENSNDILKQGDQDNYGIRIKYEGVLDTLEFKDTLEAKIILKHLKDNYDKKRVVYITKSVLIKEDTTAHGVAYKPGTKFVVQYNSDYDKTAFIFSHEFLHNLGLSHSKETKNIFGMLVQSDLMSPNPLILTGNMSVRTKEDLWEQLIRSSQFYEFRPVDEK